MTERMTTRGSGVTIALFFACFVLAQADKQLMSLLSVPVQQSMHLTDTQLGLLQGFAFALSYAIAGIPIARLLDGGNRVRIASVCVFLWSLATILCGIAGSFPALMLGRAATAIGEAALAPAALSVLAQIGERRQIARNTGLMMSAPHLGGGIALAMGGAVLYYCAGPNGTMGPWDEPWRMVFLVFGMPGLFLALLLARLGKEPDRAKSGTTAEQTVPPLTEVIAEVFKRSLFLRYYYIALLFFGLFLYAFISWYTVLLVREYHLTAATAGGYAGLVYATGGVAGTIAAIAMASFRRDDSTRALIGTFCVIGIVLVPVSIVLPHAPSLFASLSAYVAFAFLSAMIVSLMSVPVQIALPQRMQARAIALFVFAFSAVSGSLGPLSVGMMSDYAGLSLGASMSIVATGSIAISTVLMILSWRALGSVQSAK